MATRSALHVLNLYSFFSQSGLTNSLCDGDIMLNYDLAMNMNDSLDIFPTEFKALYANARLRVVPTCEVDTVPHCWRIFIHVPYFTLHPSWSED